MQLGLGGSLTQLGSIDNGCAANHFQIGFVACLLDQPLSSPYTFKRAIERPIAYIKSFYLGKSTVFIGL